MEQVKSMTDELRGQRWTSILLGYVLVLAIMFVAFEYTQREIEKVEQEKIFESITVEEEMIPITTQKVEVAPPPPAPKEVEVINIVEDEQEIQEEEVNTTEEMNQSVTSVHADGAHAVVAAAPVVGPVREEGDDDAIYEVVEANAEFPGGEAACVRWLSENIKYPAIALEQGIKGRVVVQFVVNKDGSIQDVKVLRSPDPSLSKEAERVVKMMPKWKPARQGNKTVRSRFNLPVNFTIR